MRTGPVQVGIIGAGDVSSQYLEALGSYPDLAVVGIADLDMARAQQRALAFGIDALSSPSQLLELAELELVVNLTPPAAHAAVALATVQAGKHVWSEKPLSLDKKSARAILDAAEIAGVSVGNAPDTVLGRGIQSSFRRLAEGAVGNPQTLLTLMQGPGPERWHPRPEFLFQAGAGPLFDIGPYYVTTMAMIFGRAEAVEATGHRASATRVVGTGPRAGTEFPVEVWTHVSVHTTFASGAVGTSVYSFDSPVRRQLFEVTGPGGTLTVPVSGFDGDSLLTRSAGQGVREPLLPEGSQRERGVGALEMARAVRAGRPPRLSGELAFHVLEVLLAIEESIATGRRVAVASDVPRPDLVPVDWDPRERTL